MFLCILCSLTYFVNFSFCRNGLNTFPWWCATDIMRFLFVRRISSYFFMISAASSGFSTSSAFSFNSPASILSLITRESISYFFYFFRNYFFCLLGVFRTSPQLQTKYNYYTVNVKYPLQTKNTTPLSTKRILLYMIKSCKSTLSQAFLQNCFSDQPNQ